MSIFKKALLTVLGGPSLFYPEISGWYIFGAHRKEGKSNQIKEHSAN